mmetsp:Transcript_83561/g.202645  ORF Transcript_83561/g.202645 Transcript_83561/m.202645 type:complete len:204 (-) Transcript_83561:35-646(-)
MAAMFDTRTRTLRTVSSRIKHGRHDRLHHGAVLQGQPRPQGPRRPQGVLQGVRRRVHGVRQQEGGRDRARRGDRDRPGFPRQGGPHVGPPRALRGEQGAQRQEARADVLRELRAVPHGDGRRVRVPEELLRLRDRVQQRRRRVPLRRQGHRVRGDARRQGVRVQGSRLFPPRLRHVRPHARADGDRTEREDEEDEEGVAAPPV